MLGRVNGDEVVVVAPAGAMRFKILESCPEGFSVGIQDLRTDLREINRRLDRQLLSMMAIGATQIALLITLIARSG